MKNNKICINKSVFSLFVGVLSMFFLLAFYQKIIYTVITQNNQAAVRKQQTLPMCSRVISFSGEVIPALKDLGISDPYSPPAGFGNVNLNGKLTTIYRPSMGLIPNTFYKNDVVSLIPADHLKIPCQGDYLGNVWQQNFDDTTTKLVLNGFYLSMNGFNNIKPITADRVNYNLKDLCSQQRVKLTGYSPDMTLTLQQMGCNFITVAKTAKIGGQTTCNVYSTASQAYNAFLSDLNPSQFKWYSIALLGQTTYCVYDRNNVTGCFLGITQGQVINTDLAQKTLCPLKDVKDYSSKK